MWSRGLSGFLQIRTVGPERTGLRIRVGKGPKLGARGCLMCGGGMVLQA